MLAEDGNVAGLDKDGTVIKLSGFDVDGCVGVEFPEGVTIKDLLVRAGAVENACGTSPCGGDGGCGSGHTMAVFVGTSPDTLTLAIYMLPISGVLAAYEVAAPSSVAGRFAAVCRVAFGGGRDDVVVDSIRARCR